MAPNKKDQQAKKDFEDGLMAGNRIVTDCVWRYGIAEAKREIFGLINSEMFKNNFDAGKFKAMNEFLARHNPLLKMAKR